MAITNASMLAEFGSGIGTVGAVLQVDNDNKRVGIGTTNPQAMLQVGTGVTVFGNAGIASFTSLKLSGETDSTSTSTGTLTVTGGVGIGLSLTVGGDVSVGGTITYEDVTNVDSIGIVTARSGLRVVGGGLTCVGVATFFNDINSTGINLTDYIVHTGDTNTKFGFPSDDTVSFDTAGSERLRIDSSGKILAGTTSSRNVAGGAAKLQIEAASSEGMSLIRTTNDSGATYFSLGKVRTGGSNSGRCIAGDNIGAISWNPSDGTDLNHAAAEIQCLVASGIDGNDVPGDLVFKTNGGTTTTTERLRINSSGNVTIGNDGDSGSNPSAGYDELCIEGGNEDIGMCFLSPAANNVKHQISFGDSNNNQSGRIIYDHDGDYMSLYTGNGERLRITSSGLVGINTTVPSAMLSFGVKRSTQTYPPICFQADYGPSLADAAISTTDDSGGVDIMIGSNVYMGQNGAFTRYHSSYGSAAVRCQYTGNTLFYNKSGNNAPEESMRINGDGEVGIGTNNPTKILDVLAKDGVTQAYIEKQTASVNSTYVTTLTLSAESGLAAAGGFGPSLGFQHCFGGSNYAGCSIASQCGSDTNTASLTFYPRNYGYTEAMRINHLGRVGIGSTMPTYPLDVKHTSEGVVRFQSTKTTADGVEMSLYHNSSSPADGDQLGYIQFTGNDDALNPTIYNAIIGYSKDVTNGTEDGELRFYGRKNSVFTQQMTLYGDSGDLKIHNGNLTFGTGDLTGIDFSAQTPTSATGATTDGELLDHYERGTWNPNFQTSNSNWSGGVSVSNGNFVRVGKLVYIFGRITWTSTGGTGNMQIVDLPVSIANGSDYDGQISVGYREGLSYPRVHTSLSTNANRINLHYVDASSPYNSGSIVVGALQSSGSIYFAGCYTAY